MLVDFLNSTVVYMSIPTYLFSIFIIFRALRNITRSGYTDRNLIKILIAITFMMWSEVPDLKLHDPLTNAEGIGALVGLIFGVIIAKFIWDIVHRDF